MPQSRDSRRPVLAGFGGPIGILVFAVALVMAISHLWQAGIFYWSSGQFKNLHLGLALVLVFLILAGEARTPWSRAALLLLAALSLIPLGYIHIEFDGLINERVFGPLPADVLITFGLLCLTLVAGVLQWGWTLPTISGLALAYGYFGAYMPGDLFYHAGIDFDRLMSYTAVPFFQGLLGSLTGLSATLIFVFMVYAGLLKTTGGIRFVMTIGRAIGGRSRSGPAQIAVVASGLMGMISGSTVGNVASTGAMTIPMMKRQGYRPEHAGAIEAVASTGGQFAPPVMGLTAFLIVGMTGIPYNQIMLAAICPALIYYGYLMVAVHIQAIASGLDHREPEAPAARQSFADAEEVSLVGALRQYGHLLLSIGVLIYLLLIKLPPAYSALCAMGVIVVTEAVKQLYVHRGAPAAALGALLRIIADGLVEGARNGAQLAIIIATIGILVDILVITGFAQKLSHLMLNIAGGELWILLSLAALSCLAFGLGMPTPAAYILVALLGAPALIEFGVPLLTAHMFVFYFANMSAITPPVAVAALVAAKLAKANYFATAFAAFRLGIPGFVLPFLFVQYPELLLLEGTAVKQILTFAGAFIAVVAANMVIVNYGLRRLRWFERLILFGGIVGLFQAHAFIVFAGAAAILAVFALQCVQERRVRHADGAGNLGPKTANMETSE